MRSVRNYERDQSTSNSSMGSDLGGGSTPGMDEAFSSLSWLGPWIWDLSGCFWQLAITTNNRSLLKIGNPCPHTMWVGKYSRKMYD